MRFRLGYAVTSVGIAHGLGSSTSAALGALFRGERGLARVQVFPERLAKPHWVTAGCTALGAEDPWEFPRSPTDAYPTRQRLLGARARSAVVADARRATERWGSERVAVLLGTSTGGIEASERAFLDLARRGALPEAYSFDAHHAFSALAREVAVEIGATGPCYVISTACSSSAKALAAAGRLLNTGFADAVLVAGVDSLCLTTLLGFGALGVLAADGAEPFASVPKGMSIAEGAAFLLLQRSTEGEVFLIAAGESSDAHQMTHPHPEGEGAERAMREALSSAGVDTRDVAYVNAHGTGTQANDVAETLALGRVFDHRPWVSSTKGATGHLLGACGATEAIICVEAICRGLAPGNGPWALSPDLPFEVPQQATPKNIPFALSNAFAFGGSNASLLFASREGRARLTSSSAGADVTALELVQAVQWPAHDRDQEGGALPEGPLLSERARGRASPLTRLFAELLGQLSERDEKLRRCPQIFASAYGEMDTTLKLLEQQARSGESSPLRFSVSVHNAAQGLLSIATGHQGFATSLAAGSDTFAMALIEAAALLGDSGETDILLLLADEAAAAPLCREHFGPVAVGFQLRAVRRPTGAALRSLSLPRRGAPAHATLLKPPPLAATVRKNPIADALHVVWAFNNGAWGTLRLGAAESALADDAWCVDYAPTLAG